jgi:hypothetical protein
MAVLSFPVVLLNSALHVKQKAAMLKRGGSFA